MSSNDSPSISSAILEECKTPTTKEQYEEISNQTQKLYLESEMGGEKEEWTVYPSGYEDKGISVFEKADSSGFTCMKAISIVPCSPEKMIEIITSEDLQFRKRWDKDLNDWNIFERITPEITVVYRSYNSPSYIISPRDFVAVSSKYRAPDGSFVTCGTSINHKKYLEENPGYVRARVILTGISVRPIQGSPNQCKCCRIIHLDPKGMIPAWIVNSQKNKGASFWLEFNQFVEKLLSEESTNKN